MAHRTMLNVMWQPGWEGAWGRMNTRICIAESLHCSPESTLLIGYTPKQNKKFIKVWKKKKKKPPILSTYFLPPLYCSWILHIWKEPCKMPSERQVAPQQRYLLLVVTINRGQCTKYIGPSPALWFLRARKFPGFELQQYQWLLQPLNINHNNDKLR